MTGSKKKCKFREKWYSPPNDITSGHPCCKDDEKNGKPQHCGDGLGIVVW